MSVISPEHQPPDWWPSGRVCGGTGPSPRRRAPWSDVTQHPCPSPGHGQGQKGAPSARTEGGWGPSIPNIPV